MKRLLSLLAIALCLTPFAAQGQTVIPQVTPQATPQAAAVAPALPDAPSWSYDVGASYVNQYVFRGQLVAAQSIEPSVEADYGDCVIGVWGNVPFKTTTGQPEADVYGSYSHALTDSLSLQPGFTLYTYANAPTSQGYYRATFEPSLALVFTKGRMTLTPKVYYDVMLKGITYEVTAVYAYPLEPLHTEADITMQAGTYMLNAATNTSPTTKASGNYGSVGVAFPFSVTKRGKLTVGVAYDQGWNGIGLVGRGIVTIGYSLSL